MGKLNVEHMSTLLSQWNEIVPPKYPVLPDIAIGEEGEGFKEKKVGVPWGTLTIYYLTLGRKVGLSAT